jgi:hypothetical protein
MRLMILILLSLGSAFGAPAQDIATTTEPTDFQVKVDELLIAGQVNDAVTYMIDLHKQYPENEAMANSLASLYREVGVIAADKTKKIDAFKKGMAIAEAVIKMNPKNGRAHFAYAANAGRMAQFMGGKDKVNYAKTIKEHGELALKYEPNYAGTYNMMAIWHFEVVTLSPVLKAAVKVLFGGMPDASLAQAETYIKKAIELEPNVGVHRFEYAKILLELGSKNDAKDQLIVIKKCKIRMPSDKLFAAEAMKLLAKIEK